MLCVALQKGPVEGRVAQRAPRLPKRQVQLPDTDTPDRLQRVLHLAGHLTLHFWNRRFPFACFLCLFLAPDTFPRLLFAFVLFSSFRRRALDSKSLGEHLSRSKVQGPSLLDGNYRVSWITRSGKNHAKSDRDDEYWQKRSWMRIKIEKRSR